MRINNEIRKRYPKFVIATTAIITAVMLLGTTAISTTTTAENVFAYRNSQATSQINDCGNGELPLNVGCQNTASQIQGDKNTVALSSQQTFPGALQTCVTCFESLSVEERAEFETFFFVIEELCAHLEIVPAPEQEDILRVVGNVLELAVGVDPSTVQDIIECLRDVLGLPPTA